VGDLVSSFTERLRQLREERGLTQIGLGARFRLSHATINRYELGRRKPDQEMQIQLADFFGVSMDYLLGRSDERAAPVISKAERLGRYPELATILARDRGGSPADLAALPEIMRASGFPEDHIKAVMGIIEALRIAREGQGR